MSYEGLEPVSLSMSQGVIVSFMSYEGLEPIASSMSQGTGPQSSEGSNLSHSETSRGLSGGAYFSSIDESNNPYDGILNLQAPDLGTVPEMVHGKGCWSEVARRFQNHPDFAALLNFVNTLGPVTIEDEDFLDFYTHSSFMDILRQAETGTPDGFTDLGNVIILHGLNPSTGPQSSEGSSPVLGKTSPDLSGGACFSSDDEKNNPYDGILNLQVPDLATVPEMVHDTGCWSKVARRFQDHPDFAAILNFMNSLGPEAIEDEDFLDFYTLSSFMNILRQEETGKEDAPYDVVKVLLNAGAVSE